MAIVHRIGKPENESESKAIVSLSQILPPSYAIVHNFELTTGAGMPYEYDICVVGLYAVWHVEVKGYRGLIQGDSTQWEFENGCVMPSPIPLANKKTKVLPSKIRAAANRRGSPFPAPPDRRKGGRGGGRGRGRNFAPHLDRTGGGADPRLPPPPQSSPYSPGPDGVWVETTILLTDDRARIELSDPQGRRVIHLSDAGRHFTDPSLLPVRTSPLTPAQLGAVRDVLTGGSSSVRPRNTVARIGLYDVLGRINQTETRTVFLAEHRYMRGRPKYILKVFHFDVYTSEDDRQRQIEGIFHDREVCRMLGAHPNLIDAGSMFAWDDDKFVLPTEYIDRGWPLRALLDGRHDRRISWGDKANWIRKMAEGLGHAHDRGVVHRDLRPLNVVVAPGGVVKLVNFDLAKVRGSPLPFCKDDLRRRLDRRYVAPEAWLDPMSADERSDIYSLGTIFYELIASTPPYEDVDQVLRTTGETPIDRELLLSELSTPGSEDFMTCPDSAVALIERMLRRNPKERQQTVGEVIEDLTVLDCAMVE